MKLPISVCCLALIGPATFPLPAEEPVELLLREIRQTVEERDRARKELLKVQSDSNDALRTLSQEKEGLSEAMQQKSN